MRCDICYTAIPAGSRVCPKCGYTMPTNKGIHSSTFVDYNDHPDLFDHIQPVKKKTTLNGEKIKEKSTLKVRSIFILIPVLIGIVISGAIFAGCKYMIPLYYDQEYLPTLQDMEVVYGDKLDGVELTNPNVERGFLEPYSLDFNENLDQNPYYFLFGTDLYMVPSGIPAYFFEQYLGYDTVVFGNEDYAMYYLEDGTLGGKIYENDEITIYFKYQNGQINECETMEEQVASLHDLMVDKIENV